MRTLSILTATLLMALSLGLSSCGKKGALERPPLDKDEAETSSLENPAAKSTHS